jgi:GTPase SAR1 family protein
MDKTVKAVAVIEEAAEDILRTFESVSAEAISRLRPAPIHGANVLASVNTLTTRKAAEFIEGLMQEERESFQFLSREPAIARVRVRDQEGVESTIFICRTTPISTSSKYASNRSPLGRLAALPVGQRQRIAARTLTVLEKEKLKPVQKEAIWDSENTEFEAKDTGVFTVEYLRPFLKSVAAPHEIEDLLSEILADEEIKAGIVEGRRRSVITQMSLRDQPILDQYQDEIFRLPLRKQLFILGPAGTGKTTTLIRRLGQMLDTEYLESEEQTLVQAISASSAYTHRESWLMFTPTELLKQYIKEAFAKEGVPASDQRIKTWYDYSHHLARNVFNVLRTANSRSGFVLKPSVSYLMEEVQISSFQLFQEFFNWQMRRYIASLQDAATIMSGSNEQSASDLGRRLRSLLPSSPGQDSIASIMTSQFSSSGEISALIGRLRAETDVILNGSLNRELNRDRDFLNKLWQFITSIQIPDADDGDEEDDPESEEEDVPSQYTGALAATAAYRRAMRTLAKASSGNRVVRDSSTNGQIIKWLGDRALNADEISKAGDSLLVQDAARHFANPVRRYLKGIPSRYRRFRRSQKEQTRWYSAGYVQTAEIGPIELDVVLLAILHGASQLLSLGSVSSSLSDPFWSALQPINELFRNQILIDEATDFATVQLGCMSLLANPRIRSVFACGDFNQRMTVWGARSLDDLRAVIPDAEVREITITYRQSRRLNELARAIVEACGGSGHVASVPTDIDFEGVSPVLCEGCSNQATLIAWVAERIREIESFVRQLPSIAVFVKDDEDVKLIADALGHALEDRNIQVEACLGGKAVGQETNVRVFAVEHIKGLEFEAVFFVGVDLLAKLHPDLYDKYLYVGTTRAATYLGFTCAGSLPSSLSALRNSFVSGWSEQSNC